MKTLKILILFAIFLMGSIVIQAQQPVPVLYAPCANCTSSNHNLGTQNFQYDQVVPFATNHITSDFGPRDVGSYDWHGGDFNKFFIARDRQL